MENWRQRDFWFCHHSSQVLLVYRNTNSIGAKCARDVGWHDTAVTLSPGALALAIGGDWCVVGSHAFRSYRAFEPCRSDLSLTPPFNWGRALNLHKVRLLIRLLTTKGYDSYGFTFWSLYLGPGFICSLSYLASDSAGTAPVRTDPCCSDFSLNAAIWLSHGIGQSVANSHCNSVWRDTWTNRQANTHPFGQAQPVWPNDIHLSASKSRKYPWIYREFNFGVIVIKSADEKWHAGEKGTACSKPRSIKEKALFPIENGGAC